MNEGDVPAEFHACMEAAIGHVADERTRIVLQIATASIGESNLEQFGQNVEKLPADMQAALDFARIVKQLVAVTPQVIALDLDRTTPLRVLGIGRATNSLLFLAKSLGHDATIVCRAHSVVGRLLRLHQVPRHDPKSAGDLPEGQFDLIVAFGGASFGTKRGWADFVLPLADKLVDTGRIFVALAQKSIPEKGYYPEVALSNLARMGARVSSKNRFVLIERDMIAKFQPAKSRAGEAVAPVSPEVIEVEKPVAKADALVSHAEDQKLDREMN